MATGPMGLHLKVVRLFVPLNPRNLVFVGKSRRWLLAWPAIPLSLGSVLSADVWHELIRFLPTNFRRSASHIEE